jgi:AbrB family looped-hinge helix DNA binding protein
MTPSGPQKIGVETKSSEAYFSQVTSGGQVRLPKDILNKLSIKENDFVAFVEDKEANIHLKKAELRIV